MLWRKIGHIFAPSGQYDWMQTHAANPVADHVGGDVFRIYFSTRDKLSRSSVAWVEVDMRAPSKVIRMAEKPSLAPGPTGIFDDSGCSVGSIVVRGKKRFMYYMGWNLAVTVPWRNSIGLAISEDAGNTFERTGTAPLMDRSAVDPYSLSYPWVLEEKGRWHMWYGSHLCWGKSPGDMNHMIKYASSSDGFSWQRDGAVVIGADHGSQYAFARPCVVRDDLFRMWYAYRGDAYRIGYAESVDGVTWNRMDHEVGIAPSPGEWDGESIEYPFVFDHGGRRYMLYCGNGYGRTGFGIAIVEDS